MPGFGYTTDRFDDEERIAVVGSFVERETAVRRDVDAERTLEGRQCLRAEVGDRHEDADHGHDGKDASRQRAVRLFTEQPDGSLPPPAWQRSHLPTNKRQIPLRYPASEPARELLATWIAG